MQISQISDFGPVQSFFRLDTDLKKRRYTGIVVALVLLIIFLGFNRFPKLDTVEADLAIATSPVAQCFQGFCLENVDDSTLWERWWKFSLTYLNLVWIGMAFAFMMAGITESFIFPGNNQERFRGQGFRGVLKGAVIGPVMALCSACIVPIATAFRRRGAGIGATVAITQGSSTMNLPALLMASMVFIPLIGGSRVVLSIVGTLLLGPIVARVVGDLRASKDQFETPIIESSPDGVSWKESLCTASIQFLRATVRQALRLGPIMIIAGFISGLAIQWVSPQAVTTWIGDDVMGILIAATLGVLINVPLMFEIPLVAAMLLAGMGTAPAGALLFTAAAGGPITYWGLSKVMPVRGVMTLALSTWSLGVIGGILLLAITALTEEGRQFSFRADYTIQEEHAVLLPQPSQGEKNLSEFWQGSTVDQDQLNQLDVDSVDRQKHLSSKGEARDGDTVNSDTNPQQLVLRLHASSRQRDASHVEIRRPEVTAVLGKYESGELETTVVKLSMSDQSSTSGQSEHRFNLDRGFVVNRVIIVWPSGIEQTIFEPPIHEPIVVHDPSQ